MGMEDISVVSDKSFYAGFWRRYIALGIDAYIVGLIGFLVLLLVILIFIPLTFHCDFVTFQSKYGKFWRGIIVQLIGWGVMLGYFVVMHGKYGATLGKMIMRIKIVRIDYSPISYKIAMIRCLGFLLSIATFGIGFLLAAFDSHKQSLHDKIAKTYVVKRM